MPKTASDTLNTVNTGIMQLLARGKRVALPRSSLGKKERAGTMSFDQRKTEAVKQCHRCGALLPGGHNFCRSCGIAQLDRAETAAAERAIDASIAPRSLETSQLLSEILVRSLTRSLSIRTAPFRSNRLGTSIVAALTIIPIWLLIVFLSPLDAYTAARAASSELNFE